MPKPPGKEPTITFASLTILLEIPPSPIRFAANIKKGMDINANLFKPANILWIMTIKVISLNNIKTSKTEPATATKIGVLANNNTASRKKSDAIISIINLLS
jgi:hypothetical protein